MTRRRLVQLTAACNIAVLVVGVGVMATGYAAPEVAFDDTEHPASSEPSRIVLPVSDDRPLADPTARLVDLPSHDLDYLPPAPRVGVLGGDAALDGGCAWIEADGERLAVRWPQGFRAGFPADDGAFELVDAAGRVAARGGDDILFTGARSGGSERLERCHVGVDTVLYVGEVTTESASD